MGVLNLFLSQRTVAPCLRATFWRLGAAAASTTVHAGYKRSILHCLFCGHTAAVAPNRQLNKTFGSFHIPFIFIIAIILFILQK